MTKHYLLNSLQEIMVRKIARKYCNPWLKISVTKANKTAPNTTWKPGNRYAITITGDHDSNGMAFRKELAQNNVQEAPV